MMPGIIARQLWVNFCRAISRNARLLYPTKLPRRPFAIEAVTGQSRHFVLRKNSEPPRRSTQVGVLVGTGEQREVSGTARSDVGTPPKSRSGRAECLFILTVASLQLV